MYCKLYNFTGDYLTTMNHPYLNTCIANLQFEYLWILIFVWMVYMGNWYIKRNHYSNKYLHHLAIYKDHSFELFYLHRYWTDWPPDRKYGKQIKTVISFSISRREKYHAHKVMAIRLLGLELMQYYPYFAFKVYYLFYMV